jgi:hypothetical protein
MNHRPVRGVAVMAVLAVVVRGVLVVIGHGNLDLCWDASKESVGGKRLTSELPVDAASIEYCGGADHGRPRKAP